jgi:hypothetical protein
MLGKRLGVVVRWRQARLLASPEPRSDRMSAFGFEATTARSSGEHELRGHGVDKHALVVTSR